MSERKAGTYAQERFDLGLRNYRRRMRPYWIGFIAMGLIAYMTIWAIRGLDWWSFVAGLVAGGLFTLATAVRDEPPEFIAKWGRGAEGERKTAKAIEPLLQQGWKVRHDVELGRGNADHLLRSPDGTAFLVETKALAGQISIEHGKLTCRYIDDPDEVRRYELHDRVLTLRDRVSTEWARRTGRPAPAIQALVVVWGAFADRRVTVGEITYVVGDELLAFLRDACSVRPAQS